jgi:hypothetical protein
MSGRLHETGRANLEDKELQKSWAEAQSWIGRGNKKNITIMRNVKTAVWNESEENLEKMIMTYLQEYSWD